MDRLRRGLEERAHQGLQIPMTLFWALEECVEGGELLHLDSAFRVFTVKSGMWTPRNI